MISEVDIKDWDSRIKDARTAVDDLDDYSRMTVGIDPIGPRTYLEKFIADVEKQILGQQKQVAALFKPRE